jgi:hypothetical protein
LRDEEEIWFSLIVGEASRGKLGNEGEDGAADLGRGLLAKTLRRGEGLGWYGSFELEGKFNDLGEDAESRGTRFDETRYFLSPSFLSFPLPPDGPPSPLAVQSTAAAVEFCLDNPLPLLVAGLTRLPSSILLSSPPKTSKSHSCPRFGNSSLTTLI